MKKGFTALVASAVMCSVAFASPTANEPSFTGLNATEHAALFGEGSTAQAVALDGAEMKATEGEWINFAVGGAIGGGGYAANYAYQRYYRGNTGYRWNNTRFMGNIATGAVIGGTFGAAGAMAGGGKTIGNLMWKANGFGANYGANLGWRR